jgi:carbamate kinase
MGKPWHVCTIVTEIEVDKDDPAFKNPTKPIGAFLTKEQADMAKLEDPSATFVEDSGRGYRRVVASPQPKAIVEKDAILNALDAEFIVIACGGGGIPVYEEDNALVGVPAVIDKDLAGELLAQDTDADKLILLTAVDYVAVNFGKPDQKNLEDITVEEAEQYVAEGQFGKGSMEPKVKAGIKFAKSRPGRVCIIGSLDKASEIMDGKSGTRIHM